MKLKLLAAASALAVTGVAAGVSQSASAGCGVSITAHNREPSTATVDWEYSYVRAKTVGVWGPWKRIGTYETAVAPEDTETRAFTLDLSCNLKRQYKLLYYEGGGSEWEYFPADWPDDDTEDITPHIDLD